VGHIEILLKEYDTLRAEIIARQSGAYQATVIAGAVFAWVLSHTSGRKLWLTIATLSVLFILAAYRVIKDECLISWRVADLETQINQLAGVELLKWHNHFGWSRSKIFQYLWKR
jgi:hypothetical protein